MPKVFIMTLGFEEKFCFRALLRHEIQENDRLVFITGRLIERVKKAFDTIKKFVKHSYGNSVELQLIELTSYDDIYNSVEILLEKLGKIIRKNDEVIVNLSGGMRILLVIVLLALLLKGIRNVQLIELELEDSSGIVKIDLTLLRLPEILSNLTQEKVDVLKEIIAGKTDVGTLSKALNKDESTIRRHLSSLESLGLIRVEKKKPLSVIPEKIARLILFAWSNSTKERKLR